MIMRMAALILTLAAIAGAALALINWLHGIHLIGAVPSWIPATALLIVAALVAVGFVSDVRTARR